MRLNFAVLAIAISWSATARAGGDAAHGAGLPAVLAAQGRPRFNQ